MIRQDKNLVRSKFHFRKQFLSLQYLNDTDDEEKMKKFKEKTNHKLTLEVPSFLTKHPTMKH